MTNASNLVTSTLKKKTNVFKFATPALQKWYKNLILRRIENIRFSNLGITIRLKSRYEQLSFLDRQKSKYLLDTRPGRNLTATTPSMTLQLLLLRPHQNRNKQSTFPAQKKKHCHINPQKIIRCANKISWTRRFPPKHIYYCVSNKIDLDNDRAWTSRKKTKKNHCHIDRKKIC